MKTEEFARKTDIGKKTAIWLYDHVFDATRQFGKQRTYTEDMINWVIEHKYEYVTQQCNLRQVQDSDYPVYISDTGIVYNYRRKIMEEYKLRIIAGYKYVTLWYQGKHVHHCVHRLVAQAFIPNPNHYPFVNHIDGNKLNNTVSNLEWCTATHNSQHAYQLGLSHNDQGFQDSQSYPIALFDEEDKLICIFGSLSQAEKWLHINMSTLARLAQDPYRLSRKYQCYVRFLDGRCNDYPEIVLKTIGVGLSEMTAGENPLNPSARHQNGEEIV